MISVVVFPEPVQEEMISQENIICTKGQLLNITLKEENNVCSAKLNGNGAEATNMSVKLAIMSHLTGVDLRVE